MTECQDRRGQNMHAQLQQSQSDRQAVTITVSRKLALLIASTAIMHAMLRREASIEVALGEPLSRSPAELARKAAIYANSLLDAVDEEIEA